MSYIRTKDGIYKATEINGMTIARSGVAFSCDIANVHFPIVFKKQDIINQADTIEELCDEFVLIGELEKRIIKPKELDKDCEGWTKEIGIPEGIIKVYGAIWTDKGLIYVAKMNEKGELKLL